MVVRQANRSRGLFLLFQAYHLAMLWLMVEPMRLETLMASAVLNVIAYGGLLYSEFRSSQAGLTPFMTYLIAGLGFILRAARRPISGRCRPAIRSISSDGSRLAIDRQLLLGRQEFVSSCRHDDAATTLFGSDHGSFHRSLPGRGMVLQVAGSSGRFHGAHQLPAEIDGDRSACCRQLPDAGFQ
jgi:hypothetical protein